MRFTIGCDPEFFLLNKRKQPVSAIGKVGGTKQEPMPLAKRGFFVQEDNVAVEFNVPPAQDQEAFIRNIQYVMNSLQRKLKTNEFSKDSALIFSDKQLAHPKAQEFGCDPDFNAWTKEINPRPKCDNPNLRSAGGHVHVGTNEDIIEVVRAMDLFLGVPSTVLDPGTERRKLYGKAGCFRPQPFGVEYRTLSNFWIFSEKTIAWVYQQTEKALQFVSEGNIIPEQHSEVIQDCINQSNKDAYEYLASAYPAITEA